MTFYNVKIVKEYILETHGKRYYVTHGDLFDRVTTQMKWLARLGDARLYIPLMGEPLL